MIRCKWCNLNNPKYIEYHDNEWCKPNFDDKYLFEMLILESFQAGLSWECILNKREDFRKAFDNFEIDKVSDYDEKKVQELLKNENIIRNKLKINAAINNSKIFKEIQNEYKTFSNYIWSFTNNKVIYEIGKTSSELSDIISKDLQKRGMKFVGSTIIYSYLQAIGVIYSHDKDCFLYMEEKWKKLWRSYTRNKKTWETFLESLIIIIAFVFVYYFFIVKNNKETSELRGFLYAIIQYLIIYMVTFIKLYINKAKLKKDNPDINLNDINEQFYVSNYESYNRLKIELKHNLIESLVAIIILSTILSLIYFNDNKNQKDFGKNIIVINGIQNGQC